MEEEQAVMETLRTIMLKNSNKNVSFSPQNGPRHGTTVSETLHSTPSCNHLLAQSL